MKSIFCRCTRLVTLAALALVMVLACMSGSFSASAEDAAVLSKDAIKLEEMKYIDLILLNDFDKPYIKSISFDFYIEECDPKNQGLTYALIISDDYSWNKDTYMVSFSQEDNGSIITKNCELDDLYDLVNHRNGKLSFEIWWGSENSVYVNAMTLNYVDGTSRTINASDIRKIMNWDVSYYTYIDCPSTVAVPDKAAAIEFAKSRSFILGSNYYDFVRRFSGDEIKLYYFFPEGELEVGEFYNTNISINGFYETIQFFISPNAKLIDHVEWVGNSLVKYDSDVSVGTKLEYIDGERVYVNRNEYYISDNDFMGSKLKLVYTDGTSETIECSAGDIHTFNNGYDAELWEPGNTYTILGYYDDYVFDIPVKIVANEIADIEIQDTKILHYFTPIDNTIIEYWNEGEHIVYGSYVPADFVNKALKVTYKDGTSEVLKPGTFELKCKHNQLKEAWKIGKTYEVTVIYKGFEKVYKADLNDTKNIKFEPLFENTINICPGFMYSYYMDGKWTFYTGEQFCMSLAKITLPNGDVTYRELDVHSTNNISLSYDEARPDTWKPGNTYHATMSFGEQKIPITFNILEIPFKSVSLVEGQSINFKEKVDLEYDKYGNESYPYAKKLENIKFNFEYFDGSSEILTYKEFVERYKEYTRGENFISLDGNDWEPDKYNCIYFGNGYFKCSVPVIIYKDEFIEPSISIDITSKNVIVGDKFKINASFTSNIASDPITWSSSDASIASVDENGNVTILKPGFVDIYATLKDDNSKAVCKVISLFKDVAGNPNKGTEGYQYYFAPVYWAAEAGITKGYDDGTFGVNKECIRSDFCIFLWRAAGCPKPKKDAKKYFSDIPAAKTASTAYNKSIAWAYEQGIAKGYADGTFGVNGSVTRKDTLIMLYRYAGKPSVSGTISFTDCKSYKKGTDTYNAILWGTKKGITAGYSDGRFDPTGNCMREQIVTFLYRYFN